MVLADQAGIGDGIDHGCRPRGQARQIAAAADLGQRLVVAEIRLQRDRVGQLRLVHQAPGRLEDAPVNRDVKMLGRQQVADAVEQLVVDEEGAQQRLFRVLVMGHLPIVGIRGKVGDVGLGHGGCFPCGRRANPV